MNNKHLLSLAFDFESLGAYPESFTDCYNFDSQSGHIISLQDIISQSGMNYIRKSLLRERKERVVKFIKENYTLSEDSVYIREEYVKCLSDMESDNFFITKSSVIFYKYYCFPHAARPYDTDLDVVLSLQQLKPFLTPYGKQLLDK